MTPYHEQEQIRIFCGDVREVLPNLESGSVNCCVTSPPYWGLRDYGTATWEGGDPECDHEPDVRPRNGLTGGLDYCEAKDPVYRDICGKCGAVRHDKQLGLEQAPELYVANMVEVFREVRRVLRDDGTLWLNLGDSYSNSGKSGGHSGNKNEHSNNGKMPRTPTESGCKPKDLVGIPWAVAKALRDPYYTGAIRDERDRIWLAAMLDAEGCMFIHKRKAGQHNGQGYHRKNDNYGPGVEICNTSYAVVERIAALVGKGSICTSEKGRFGRKQTLYRWNLRTTESREFVREIYPYLIAKRQQARILYGCPSSGERADAAHAALIGLHNGVETDVNFPEPPGMTEPGYYLRSEIIWAKSNPMPESTKDRPTKSHEQIFLMAKSKRYYYNADAIAEPAVHAGESRSFCTSKKLGRVVGRGGPSGNELPGADPVPIDEKKNKRTVWTAEDDRQLLDWLSENSPELLEQFLNESAHKEDVWKISTEPYPAAHFATFPQKLIEPCILAGCPEGGTVLDPFTGSGTTAVVARKNGCKFIGCEINPEYIELIKDRLQQKVLF